MDDKLKQLIKELSILAANPQAMDLVEPKLIKFIDDLFNEIEKAFRAERDKKGTPAAIQF